MTLRNMISSISATAIIFSVVYVSMRVTGEAEARRGVKPCDWRTYEYNRPVRGYGVGLLPATTALMNATRSEFAIMIEEARKKEVS